MNKKKIFFWADASQTIGYGHFIRTLALVDMMKDDFDCTFFTTSPNQYQLDVISPICKYVTLPERNEKFDIFLKYVSEDITVFLDGYFFTGEYQKRVKERCRKLICMSDTINHFYADVVIGYVVKPEIISRESYSKLIQGMEWVALRSPFLNIQNNHCNFNSVTICFGGTDQFFLTEKFVDYLSVNYDFKINVISSFDRQRSDNLKKKGVSVYSNISAQEMATLFSNSYFVIASASTTAIESIATHTPTIVGYYVDNQFNLYHELIQKKYALGIDNLLDENESFFNLATTISSINQVHLNKIDFVSSKQRYIALFNG